MNGGVVNSRYAKALLKFTKERGTGAQVAEEVRTLLFAPDDSPKQVSEDLQRFTDLLVKRGRIGEVRQILQMFLKLYCIDNDIRLAHLTTAVPSDELEKRLGDAIAQNMGYRIVLDSKVDPDLVGGFIFEIDDLMIDASVRNQIDTIRRQFIDKNKRIV